MVRRAMRFAEMVVREMRMGGLSRQEGAEVRAAVFPGALR